MTSAAVEAGAALVAGRTPSELLIHDDSCCAIAASWLLSSDAAHCEGESTPPRWISSQYRWGPSPWPIHLCDATAAEILDCGALAALSLAAWGRRCKSLVPVQLVQRYDREDCEHWALTWEQASMRCDWIDGSLVYHEAVGMVRDGALRVWDPTDEIFVPPEEGPGYGSVVGLAVGGDAPVSFGDLVLPPAEWVWRRKRKTPAERPRSV